MKYKRIFIALIPIVFVLTLVNVRKKFGDFFSTAKEGIKAPTKKIAELIDDSKEIVRENLGPTKKMMTAAERGEYKTVKALLSLGADVNGTDRYGNTALMFTSETGDKEMVIILLEADANVNAANVEGYTALMRAAREGQAEIVSILLQMGAKKEMIDDKKRTALDYALLMHKAHPEKKEYKLIVELLS